eukprot:GFYU01004029.1.p1 GENE.GFYU01004029.1~~GFYU01004029.1.p1  ORF type:complete len:118 (+),score=0.97 GFYU01004029.1:296-649(+)
MLVAVEKWTLHVGDVVEKGALHVGDAAEKGALLVGDNTRGGVPNAHHNTSSSHHTNLGKTTLDALYLRNRNAHECAGWMIRHGGDCSYMTILATPPNAFTRTFEMTSSHCYGCSILH